LNDLVIIERGVPTTTSNIIAEEFGIAHRELMRKMKKLSGEISTVKFNDMYKDFTYINQKGREYLSYKITKAGYMFLVMNISTKKAHDKKLLFIEAFELMEKMLLRQQNTEWSTARKQGQIARKEETDTIKEFVKYAELQGSSKSEWYYKHFTNATYKALSLLEHKKPKTRETLDLLELNQLYLAENIISKVISLEMGRKEHYKVIYEKAKIALDNFASSLFLK